MDSKKKYIEQSEIKVNNILSDMFENESNLLIKISKLKDQIADYKKEMKQYEKEYKNQRQLRVDLTEKFKDLKNYKSTKWEDFKAEYEMVLDLAEGEKESFINKAESFIEELNKRIDDVEERMKGSSEAARKKSKKLLDDLNERKGELQKKLEDVMADSGERWKEFRQSFIEKAKSLRSLF